MKMSPAQRLFAGTLFGATLGTATNAHVAGPMHSHSEDTSVLILGVLVAVSLSLVAIVRHKRKTIV